ncbi:MAG: helix-turn-helix transcriptional regulator [Pseudonocardiales bacterium]|nr:helix-turn-helix transcriptional regulator [Pseudonocardiales bacterium]
MDERLAGLIGARVCAIRVAKHQTRVVVAGLSGITTDYLYQIERGRKLPAIPMVIQLARVLGVPVSRLLEGPEAAASERPGGTDVGMVLYRALTQSVVPDESDEPPPVAELGERVRSAWRIWQSSPYRYSELARQLPVLITDTELAEQRYQREGERSERRQVQCCAVDLYGLLRTVTKRVGRVDLSLLVADRAIRAAEAASDPHRLAAAQWNLAHVLLADHEPEGAEAVAVRAAETIAPLVQAGDGDAMALCGGLRLLGALASVRQGQVWAARERVRAVVELAERTRERNAYWTAFGPTNVAMYAVSVEVEAGEAAEALRLAEQVDPDRSPSIERRVAFLIEQAKGYTQRRDYASALVLLQRVSREAPEDMAHRPAAHQLLRTVIHRGRRGVAAEAAQLADRFALPIS